MLHRKSSDSVRQEHAHPPTDGEQLIFSIQPPFWTCHLRGRGHLIHAVTASGDLTLRVLFVLALPVPSFSPLSGHTSDFHVVAFACFCRLYPPAWPLIRRPDSDGNQPEAVQRPFACKQKNSRKSVSFFKVHTQPRSAPVRMRCTKHAQRFRIIFEP